MTDRENALLAQLELERLCKEAKLPFVCLIGIPDENAIVRASLGMFSDENRIYMLAQFIDYMRKLSNPATKAER